MAYKFETNLKDLSFDKGDGFDYLKEWYVLFKVSKCGRCICNHTLESYSIVMNKITKNVVHMGSTCVKHILGTSESDKTIEARLHNNFEKGEYVNIDDLDEYVINCILTNVARLSKYTCNILLQKYKNDTTKTGEVIRNALIRRINCIHYFEEQERLRKEREIQQQEENKRLKEDEKKRMLLIEEQRQEEEKQRLEKEKEVSRINYMFMQQQQKDEEDRKRKQRMQYAEDAMYKKQIGMLIKKSLAKYFKECKKLKRENEKKTLATLQNKSKKDFKKMTPLEKEEYLKLKLRRDILTK